MVRPRATRYEKNADHRLAKEFNWWWRTLTKLHRYNPKKHTTEILKQALGTSEAEDWERWRERAAWTYELARRHDREKKLPSYEEYEKDIGHLIVAELAPPVFCPADRSHELLFELLTDDVLWSELPHGRWDLSAPDHTLQREFMRLVAEERNRRNLAKAKVKPAKGRRRRPVSGKRTVVRRGLKGVIQRKPSWRWCELLDIAHAYRITKFEEGDRGTLTTARRAAKRWFDCYMLYLYDEPDSPVPPPGTFRRPKKFLRSRS